MKRFFSAIGTQLKNFWEGTFYESTPEGGKKFSIGRTCLIILLGISIGMWTGGSEIPATMMTVLLTFVGYSLGSKGLAAIEKLVTKK